MKKKGILAVMTAAAMVASMAAPVSAAEAKTDYKIGFAQCTLASPFYVSMKDAVEKGYKLAETGDIVLLSPACSSFDWYSCFEERGDDFKRCVHMLQEGGHH